MFLSVKNNIGTSGERMAGMFRLFIPSSSRRGMKVLFAGEAKNLN